MSGPAHCDTPAWRWTREALRAPHASAEKAERVRAVFSRIARRYDQANWIHTLGRDAAWRRAAVGAARLHRAGDVLDVACGTGGLTRDFRRATTGRVVGLDFVPEMLAVARGHRGSRGIEWVEGDATALPFAPGSFDVVAIGFGLRNLTDAAAGIDQFVRVLRPGGRVVVLEFSPPTGSLLSRVSRWFIRHVIPFTGRLITGDDGGSYGYLAASVDSYYSFDRLRQILSDAGLTDVRTARRLANGAVGIHVGRRP